MASLNRVTLLGNILEDPITKNLDNGSLLAIIKIITNTSFVKKDGEKVSKSQLHRVKFYGLRAQMVNDMVKKGNKVYIEGELEYYQHEEKEIAEIRGSHFVNMTYMRNGEGFPDADFEAQFGGEL